MKHMERFQKLMGPALKFGWIVRDPFIHFNRKLVTKDREILDDAEIALIQSVDLPDCMQAVVRDMFVFSCYKGLAYSEISALSSHHITIDNEGAIWLVMKRKKRLLLMSEVFMC